jgi:hypothetical protein
VVRGSFRAVVTPGFGFSSNAGRKVGSRRVVESVEWLGMEMVPVWLAQRLVVSVMGPQLSTD